MQEQWICHLKQYLVVHDGQGGGGALALAPLGNKLVHRRNSQLASEYSKQSAAAAFAEMKQGAVHNKIVHDGG